MDVIAQALRNLSPMRLAIMAAVLLSLVGFFIFLATKLMSPSMELLYGDLEAGDSAAIVGQLQVMNVPFELKKGRSEIHVPSKDVGRLRLNLANQGLPGGGSIGYEIFDDANSLGTTNFMQNVQLVRALEGELSRTIQTLSSIKTARVHLVMPKRELFSREKQEPSASVVLRMNGAVRLNAEQVSAVQHLVATAVPGLNPARVSIIDNKGKLLAAGFQDGNEAGAMAAKAEEKRTALENRLGRTIEELLERTVGFGLVRAEVNAEMDFDRISTKEEEFNPDGQVPRSIQTIEQTESSRDAEGQSPVSVGTNLPDPTAAGGGSQSSTASGNRTEETVNFEISKKTINHIRESGIINKLSVAVLIDGNRVKNEDGELVYQPRSEAEMDLLTTLVRGAIGFDAERGDAVEVINMEFAEFEEMEEELALIFGLGKNDLLRMAEILVLGIVALLVILLVVRPLVSRAFESAATAASAAERLLADQSGLAPALAGPDAPGVPVPSEAIPEDEQFDEAIDIDRFELKIKDSTGKKLDEIVSTHPDEALSVLRAWMYQES